MRREAIEEILRLSAPEPPQQDDEFTLKQWMGWAEEATAMMLKESACRDRLRAAVDRGELTTRVVSGRNGRTRVYSKVQK